MTLSSPTSPPDTVPVDSDPENWIDIVKAAEVLGLSYRQLFRISSEKRLVPFRRLPGTNRVLFAPEDMKAIADMSLVRPLAEGAR